MTRDIVQARGLTVKARSVTCPIRVNDAEGNNLCGVWSGEYLKCGVIGLKL